MKTQKKEKQESLIKEQGWAEVWKRFLKSDKSKTDIGLYIFLQQNYHAPKLNNN